MAVDDLWYLKERDPKTKKRLPSKAHGKGKRYRVRYTDAAGESRTRFFHKKTDADAFDLSARTGAAQETKVDQGAARLTFAEYAERWRLSRQLGHSLETRRRVESNLRVHLVPAFGARFMRAITVTNILEWITRCLIAGASQSSVGLYFDVLKSVMKAAVVDKVRPDNPCEGVRISQVLRSLSKVPKWVPTTGEVLALVAVVPERYQAAIWLGAGQGMRLGEVLGMEKGTRCADFLRRELHVVQQLRFHKAAYGGFYLGPCKSGSRGSVELDDFVAGKLAEHIRRHPPKVVVLPDISDGEPDTGKEPTRRAVELLFTNDSGQPIHDQRWADMWKTWRTAAGWPEEGTFHSLRHFFATTLITKGTEPQAVQHALRHARLRTTLETYVHWWPQKDRPRGVMGGVFQEAAETHDNTKIKAELS